MTSCHTWKKEYQASERILNYFSASATYTASFANYENVSLPCKFIFRVQNDWLSAGRSKFNLPLLANDMTKIQITNKFSESTYQDRSLHGISIWVCGLKTVSYTLCVKILYKSERIAKCIFASAHLRILSAYLWIGVCCSVIVCEFKLNTCTFWVYSLNGCTKRFLVNEQPKLRNRTNENDNGIRPKNYLVQPYEICRKN